MLWDGDVLDRGCSRMEMLWMGAALGWRSSGLEMPWVGDVPGGRTLHHHPNPLPPDFADCFGHLNAGGRERVKSK